MEPVKFSMGKTNINWALKEARQETLHGENFLGMVSGWSFFCPGRVDS